MQTAFASKSLLPVAGMEMTAPHWDWVSIRLPHIAVYIGSQHGLAHVKIRDLCNLESSWLTCCICFSGIYYGHQNVNTKCLCTYLSCKLSRGTTSCIQLLPGSQVCTALAPS